MGLFATNKIVLPALLLAALLAGSSCNRIDGCKRGSGDLGTDERPSQNFSSVLLEGSFNVKLVKGAGYSVSVKAQPNLFPIITSKVEGGVLKLSSSECFSASKTVEVTVTAPSLKRVELNGSGNIRCESLFESDEFVALLNGSGNLDMDMKAVRANATIIGSGNLDMDGSCSYFDTSISGSGNISAFDFISKNVKANLNSSGNIDVFAADSLTALLSGSGNIRYKGGPAFVDASKTGSGNISKVD